ncbi:Polyprotein [Phytophthora palmivora]|uniref:Polyprotein n=1 Tax=Phytophthora palmivora TaxID=4796 RepID=A0A2P4XUX8_9STRA|nr:Polyprotein [Phytophthora palmivora]
MRRALVLDDGHNWILIRETDIIAVCTPSTTFNRLVAQLFRSLCEIESTYFNDIFAHSHAEDDQTPMDAHLKLLRRLLEVIKAN